MQSEHCSADARPDTAVCSSCSDKINTETAKKIVSRTGETIIDTAVCSSCFDKIKAVTTGKIVSRTGVTIIDTQSFLFKQQQKTYWGINSDVPQYPLHKAIAETAECEEIRDETFKVVADFLSQPDSLLRIEKAIDGMSSYFKSYERDRGEHDGNRLMDLYLRENPQKKLSAPIDWIHAFENYPDVGHRKVIALLDVLIREKESCVFCEGQLPLCDPWYAILLDYKDTYRVCCEDCQLEVHFNEIHGHWVDFELHKDAQIGED